MRMRFTREQLCAIEAVGGNLLLTAAAGSGKTTVLVERILRLIEGGSDIERMLVITFTRAAASDMREKLTERLTERAEGDPNFIRQLDAMERSSISTIHSFLTEALRTHFEAAGVDPAFRIADDVELNQLLSRAIEEAMEEVYVQGGDDLAALTLGRPAKNVFDLVWAMHRFSDERPDPDGFLRDAVLSLTGDGEAWFSELLGAAKRSLNEALAFANRALEVADSPEGPAVYAPALLSDAEQLAAAVSQADYPAFHAALSGIHFEKRPAFRRKDASEREIQLAEEVSGMRDRVKKLVADEKKRLMDPAGARDDLAASVPAMRALVKITAIARARFTDKKAARSALSFGDLEHRALLAFSDPGVQAALREKYDYVFVDEYQDVSDVQEALVARIVRPDNLFMVGDVKQSIYRFRQAEPSLFIGKMNAYKDGAGGRVLALTQNFRSRPTILEYVNGIFQRVMTGGAAEIEYDDMARLHPGRTFAGDDPPVELHVIAGAGAESEDEEAEAEAEPSGLSQGEREGALVASIAARLLGGEIAGTDGRMRRVQMRDIVVLSRKRSGLTSAEKALREAGIAVYADTADRYFDVLEVRTMVNLLTVVFNRRRDVPLLAVLRSPIVGLSSTDLARIRAAVPEGSFRDACVEYLEKEGEIAEKLRDFEALLDRFRLLSRALPLSRLVDMLMLETGYYAFASGLPGGAQRRANLDMLIQHADAFERTQSGGLSAFLDYLRDVNQSGDDFGMAHMIGEGEDVVRLMTAHKSKGLEFPIVIAIGMGANLKKKRNQGELTAHRSLGAGMKYNDRDLFTTRDTLPRRAILARRELEELNEEMRILYVMLTRAKDRLILVGSVSDLAAARQKWNLLSAHSMTPGSFLDVIAPVTAEADMRFIPADGIIMPSAPAHRRRAADALSEILADAEVSDGHPMTWRYPHESEVLLPVKLTASGIARDWIGPEIVPDALARPRFMQKDGMTGAERGTSAHRLLSLIDLSPFVGASPDAILPLVHREAERLLLRGALFGDVETDLAADFLSGETGQRMLRSDRIEREWPFTLRVTAKEARAADSDAPVFVQGVVDCCFFEDGGWVLLDYKTDRAEDLAALQARYLPQMELYAMALHRLTGAPVRDIRIVLLRMRQEILLRFSGKEQ